MSKHIHIHVGKTKDAGPGSAMYKDIEAALAKIPAASREATSAQKDALKKVQRLLMQAKDVVLFELS